MLKTKLISLATMSAIAVGALAPMTSVGAAEVDGNTKAQFNITEQDNDLILNNVPNMRFDDVSLGDMQSRNMATPFVDNTVDSTLGRAVTNNSENSSKDGILVTDNRLGSDNKWTLTAAMTEFTGATNGSTINTTDGISLDLSDGTSANIPEGDAETILDSEDGGLSGTTYGVETTSTANLAQNSSLTSADVGDTFNSNVTWTLSDTLSF